jgi:CspA family cold shock protein
MTTVTTTGRVKFFNDRKGFGFIADDSHGPDVFVHRSAVERAGITALKEGDKLTFDIQSEPCPHETVPLPSPGWCTATKARKGVICPQCPFYSIKQRLNIYFRGDA